MTTLPRTAVTPDRHDRSRRHDHAERNGVLGWQNSAWSSVLMAAVTAIACQLVFTSLGLAIGATAAEVSGVQSADAGELGIAAGAWWLVTGAVSLLVGGLVLGRLSGIPRSADLVLAAIAVWAVTAVFGFVVVWSGMMSAATSPLAAISAPAIQTAGSQQSITRSEFAGGIESSDRMSAAAGDSSITTERAQSAARTASWWTVAGMLVGAGVTIGGALMSAPKVTVIVGD